MPKSSTFSPPLNSTRPDLEDFFLSPSQLHIHASAQLSPSHRQTPYMPTNLERPSLSPQTANPNFSIKPRHPRCRRKVPINTLITTLARRTPGTRHTTQLTAHQPAHRTHTRHRTHH